MKREPKGFLRGLKGFFEWFDPGNFMDTYQEWHAFVEGFGEGFCFWNDVYKPDDVRLAELMSEHHYYAAGRVFGFTAFILLVTGMVLWIIGAVT